MSHSQPLAGFTVVEIGHSVAAPYTGFILAGLGAELIKVENPEGGDAARGWGPPFHAGSAPHFTAFNRDKHSVTADLRDPAQRDALREFILDKADAVICNMRAGAAEELGVGPIGLREADPSLVYCEIGAFGHVGPMADKPGYDPLMQAYGGMMSITGESVERPPIRVGVSIIDMGSGMWGAIGIMGALIERRRTGIGTVVRTSLFETALAWTATPICRQQMSGQPQLPQGSGAAGIVPYQAFKTQDGWLVIGAGNDGLFAKLARAMQRPDLASDERFRTNRGRVSNKAQLLPLIKAFAAGFTNRQLGALLDEAGVPNAPVQTIGQVVADPQTAALGIVQQGPEGAFPTVGLPLTYDGERPPYRRAAPALGENTREWLPQTIRKMDG
ncbi:CaiB/BaiF CoA transferase family protein [Ramlibacter tataouinensis]|uniref:Formyl-coenzyme A transferase (Formyl-CoA transferase)-like protein n=1 Tax=Ramlibacter tataouinensis (strain ATCC BAA-407 / DSM 14655 / LMG 21543 / TTB310) TaxID=365046 RepID=F5Y440_RAMTT|nr:CoA transferase [Ramlibacter tataouinensis]AEG92505.1 formyl-coenzyme A transferase (Formyl-CoA transferase)-like protein [Ramlibacter tataouinensis TTB310]